MQLQNVSLGFGNGHKAHKKHKQSKKSPSIVGGALKLGIVGLASGLAARRFVPVQKDFFEAATDHKVKKFEVTESVKDFIGDYGKDEIQEARVFRTALTDMYADKKFLDKKKLHGIKSIIKDDSIPIIKENDAQELKSAVIVLKEKIQSSIIDAPKGSSMDTLLELDDKSKAVASSAHKFAQVKNLLVEHTQSIKGIGVNAQGDIKTAKDALLKGVQSGGEKFAPISKQAKLAFNSMIKKAVNTQRKLVPWVILPTGIAAAFGAGHAAGKKSTVIA